MTSYTLEYADGRVNDIVADSDNEAVQYAMDRFDEGSLHNHEWDTYGPCGDNGRRMLIWENETEAYGDDGSHAVAMVVAVEVFGD